MKLSAVGHQVMSTVGRVASLLGGLLPSPPSDEAPSPDIDGRRDSGTDHRRAVLRAKSQMTQGGQGTTSYEPVDRGALDE
jgi:hypothetical protein